LTWIFNFYYVFLPIPVNVPIVLPYRLKNTKNQSKNNRDFVAHHSARF